MKLNVVAHRRRVAGWVAVGLSIAASLGFPRSALAQSGNPAEFSVLIQNVRLFDGERVVPRTNVVLQKGRILAIGPNAKGPPGTPVVNGEGKTLMPGLIDSHTHTWGTALRDDLVLGVTTVLDMFTDPKQAAEFKSQQDGPSGREIADFRSAGILVTSPKGHGTEYGMQIPTITSPSEAQAFVDARIAEGSDYIKIVYDDGMTYGMKIPTIDKTTLEALVVAAHARKKLAVVHIGSYQGARDAIDVGADALVHLFVDRAPDADFAALVKSHRAFVVPTLTVLESVAWGKTGETVVSDARLAPYISADNVENLKRTFPPRANNTRSFAAALETVKQLHDAGVPILAGTDAPNPGTAHGASMHRELELLVKAGLTPTEALRAATSVPAKWFALGDRGRIAPGLRGDVVLVNGDPTTDIFATRNIVAIWKQGLPVDREQYRAHVAKEAASLASGTFPVPEGSESGDITDFEDGTAIPKFGSGWFPTTDQLAGGKSSVKIEVVPGGANGSSHAFRIAGTLDAGLPYGWSGSMFNPAKGQMAPVNLSSKKELRFWAKGDGKSYVVMLFARSKGMQPAIQRIAVTSEWSEIVVPFSAFPTDARDVMGFAIVASGTPGEFTLLIDDVRLR